MKILIWAAEHFAIISIVALIVALPLRLEPWLPKKVKKYLLIADFFIVFATPMLGFLKDKLDEQWKTQIEQQLKQQSDVYNKEISLIKGSGKIIQQDLSSTKQKHNLEHKVLEAKLSIADIENKTSQLELDRLKKQQKPRSLSPTQRTKLKDILSKYPKKIIPEKGVHISFNIGDTEARSFANQIKSVLESSGWKAVDMGEASSSVNTKGVMIFVKNESTPPPYAHALQQALFKIGISTDYVEDSSFAEDQVLLFISSKHP